MVSADGRFVAFNSSATDLTALPPTIANTQHVYRRDLQTGTTIPVGVIDGAPQNPNPYGALNTNVLRMTLNQYKEWQAQGEEMEVCCLGNKGLGFMQRLGANIVSQAVQLGDRPQMDKLIGAVKVMLDGYGSDRFDRLMLGYTRFINTMKQEPVIEQLLPLSGEGSLEPPARAGGYPPRLDNHERR